jgi:mono/diheme cytochrome c family protein
LFSLLVVVALGSVGDAAHAQTQSSIARGQEIAERACLGCHALSGSAGTTIKGKNVPTLAAIAGRGWAAERLQAYIATPHRPMPAVPLQTSEIRDIVAYILSLN